jgi:hypothetical protein
MISQFLGCKDTDFGMTQVNTRVSGAGPARHLLPSKGVISDGPTIACDPFLAA